MVKLADTADLNSAAQLSVSVRLRSGGLFADMLELADRAVSKTVAERRVSSILTICTQLHIHENYSYRLYNKPFIALNLLMLTFWIQ